jgi:FAD/FMN-containing dehydrogenase
MTTLNLNTQTKIDSPWPVDRLTRLENFGHSLAGPSYLYRPSQPDQIFELFEQARKSGFKIGLRGASRSYGDAALNSGGVMLDCTRMNRILEWDPTTGVIEVEPGVTIQQLWQYILEDGWWPPVVPGTMAPTLGGCLAMNVHGKNNYQAGTIGEHVLEFTALLPDGDTVTCSPQENEDLFHALIGGLGVLGVFTSIRMQMKRVFAGDLWVGAWAVSNLQEMLDDIDVSKGTNDYIVGWVDTTAGGEGLGRGQLHSADYLSPAEEPYPARSLNVAYQTLPDTIMGLMPKSMTWKFMRPFMNNLGLWGVNTAKYLSSRTIGHNKRSRQSFAAFNFLLDYVPDWERAYGAGGLIQYQSFIPTDDAHAVFLEMLRLSQEKRLPSFLGVVKRHRPDPFLLTHAVDGFSLALDYRLTRHNRPAVSALSQAFNDLVVSAGGRFYFAKDSTLTPAIVERFLGPETISSFLALKRRVDPHDILQSDLYRRCFAPLLG